MKGKENCFPSKREGSHNFSSNLPHRVCNLRARFEEMIKRREISYTNTGNKRVNYKEKLYRVLRSTSTEREM